jgi:hypothetical protein
MSKSGMIGCNLRDFVAVSSVFQMNSTVDLFSSNMNSIIIFMTTTYLFSIKNSMVDLFSSLMNSMVSLISRL